MSDKILIDEFGFREYDARWLFPDSINELGIEAVGKGFGTQVINKVKNPTVILQTARKKSGISIIKLGSCAPSWYVL